MSDDPDHLRILPAEPAEYPDLWVMQRIAYATETLLYDEPIPPMTQSQAEAIADCTRHQVLKACLAGRTVGSIRYRVQDGTCHIAKLMVLPEYRGRGIGSALLRAVETAVPGLRYELFTGTRSLGNIRLYEHIGYRIFRTDQERQLVYLEKPADSAGAAGAAVAPESDAGAPRLEKAVPTDLPEVFALFRAAVSEMRRQGIDQWDEVYPSEADLAGDIANGELWLLRRANRIAAAVVLNEQQDSQYKNGRWQVTVEPIAVIHRLCVHPAEQGAGVATRVMTLAEQHLRDSGYRAIRLDTYPPNRPAVRLYERLGYRRAGTVEFRKGTFYLYEKALDSINNSQTTGEASI
jgi:ribosomal protein S18 acetylase RimI-like enzyme